MNRGLYAGLPRTTIRMRGLQVDGQTGATAVGDQTGQLVSTNTYIGYQAGQNTVQQASGIAAESGAGLYNTFIGYQAGQTNTSGDSNVFIGYQAGQSNATASTNVFIGSTAGQKSTGINNVFVGCRAGNATTTGAGCVAIGYDAQALGTSTNGTAVGYSAGYQSNANSVAIGYAAAGGTNTQAVAIGQNASGGGSASNANGIVIGYTAAFNVASTNGVAIGYQSGRGGCASCVMVGYNTGVSSSGVNTFIGYQSGYSPGAFGTTYATTTGTGQTCIGYQTGQAVVSATAPNYITCLGWETTVGASGGVAIGTDHTGAGATTSTQDAFQLGTSNHTIVSSGKVKMAAHGITSGALSTVTLSSGTGAQVDTTCDRNLAVVISVTLATDTVAFALSPDNTTYTTLATLTPGVATSSDLFMIPVPAGWYVKCTITGSATIGANSVYY
jgi:hypothetical protein